MIDERDRHFVEHCLDNHFAAFGLRLPAATVPEAMRIDEPDEDGFVAWKMLPSTVTEADVDALEADAGASFPPVFRAYLTTRHTLGMDWFDLPPLPMGDPLAQLKKAMHHWSWLVPLGYLPFTEEAAGGIGPLCFDTRRREHDGDCPIVLFDRDDFSGVTEYDRDHLETLARTTEPSFRAMMQVNFPDEMASQTERVDADEPPHEEIEDLA